MNVDPTPLSALLPVTPRALDRLVTRCLAKDPDDRWQTAHDLLIQLRRISAEGGASEVITTVEKPETGHYWPWFLPDGKHFLYLAWSSETDLVYKLGQSEFEDLYVLPLDAEGKPGKPFPVVQGPYHKDEPQFSYDGKWLAYISDETGRFEVYVTSFPELDQKLKVTDAGIPHQLFSHNARGTGTAVGGVPTVPSNFVPTGQVPATVHLAIRPIDQRLEMFGAWRHGDTANAQVDAVGQVAHRMVPRACNTRSSAWAADSGRGSLRVTPSQAGERATTMSSRSRLPRKAPRAQRRRRCTSP